MAAGVAVFEEVEAEEAQEDVDVDVVVEEAEGEVLQGVQKGKKNQKSIRITQRFSQCLEEVDMEEQVKRPNSW